ncbi:MAG TPA: DUF916 domain-containing protein [Solirubrobacter sp.]|nr:DUF916 domain-containing protein [Solirubrobacter sp.]
MFLRSPSPCGTAILVALGLGGALFAGPAAAAREPSWTLSPAANQFGSGRSSFTYTLSPGAEVADGVVVANHGDSPLRLTLRGADAATNEAGEISLHASSSGVGAWVRLARGGAVTVPPGQSVSVPFSLALPDDAAPGDHVGGIVASSPGSTALPIRVRAGGPLKPSLAVEDVRVDGDAVKYTVHNTGNAILSARQTVSVSGPFGSFGVDANTLVDTPALLPGERWPVSAPVPGVRRAVRLSATVTLVPLLTDAAGSTAPLAARQTTAHTWAIPWALPLALLVAALLATAALTRRRIRA